MERRLIIALLLLAAAGCEYRPMHLPGPDSGDSPSPSPSQSPSPSPVGGPGDCDPVGQNCGGGQRCAPDCMHVRYACASRGANSRLMQGAVCTLEEDCVPGY